MLDLRQYQRDRGEELQLGDDEDAGRMRRRMRSHVGIEEKERESQTKNKEREKNQVLVRREARRSAATVEMDFL